MEILGSLTKVDQNDDGSLTVFGIASTGSRDNMGEIVTPEAMKAAIPLYLKYPTIRVMHEPIAAGTALECSVDDDGVTQLVAKIVDPDTVLKIRAGVYRGFSIGGSVLRRDPEDPTIITALKLAEISLVDRPANEDCAITLFKTVDLAPNKSDTPAAVLRAALEQAKGARVGAPLEKGGEAPAPHGLLEKVEHLDAQLKKALAEIELLKATPMPPKAAAASVVVDKVEDAQGFAKANSARRWSDAELSAAFHNLSPREQAEIAGRLGPA